jgi:hypothetical protein
VVEEMDTSGVYAKYRNDGKGGMAFDPAMMISLLLYCFASGGIVLFLKSFSIVGKRRKCHDRETKESIFV